MEDFKLKIRLNKEQTDSLINQLSVQEITHYGDFIKVGNVTFILDKTKERPKGFIRYHEREMCEDCKFMKWVGSGSKKHET